MMISMRDRRVRPGATRFAGAVVFSFMAVIVSSLHTVPAIAGSASAPVPTDPCPSDSDDVSVCGLANPEDMVPLPQSEWVLASGFSPDALYRVDTRARKADNLVGTIRQSWDKKTYAQCPGPLRSGELLAHGVAVADGETPVFYVVNHGGREAIEVYRVRRRDASLTWVGCVPTPQRVMINSIAALPSGDIVATNIGNPETNFMPDIIAGKVTGEVRIWSKAGGWRTLSGSEGSGPNGIVAAPDGRFVYVAMSGTREVVRISLDGKLPSLRSETLSVLPDNLRWTSDGKLTATGMRFDPQLGECMTNPSCYPPFDILEVNPETLDVLSVMSTVESRRLPPPTTALRVGREIWVGSFRANRIWILPAKQD